MDEFEELGDEFPDIHSLFLYYNDLYFNGVLLGNTTVEWSSSRMTLCGGICRYHPLSGCQIKLSEPLLKLRPVRDLKMVLLHEMIHAHNMTLRIRDPDPGGHGPPFVDLMNKINRSNVPDPQRPPGGYNITTTHSMHGEVDNYRTHWWECERCKKVIKRAMNRPPQEADCIGRTGARGDACRDPNCGYHTHLRGCGGAYVKVKEPPPKPKVSKKKPPGDAQQQQQQQQSKPVLPPGQQRLDGLARGAKRPPEGPPLPAGETAAHGPLSGAGPSTSGVAVTGPGGKSGSGPGGTGTDRPQSRARTGPLDHLLLSRRPVPPPGKHHQHQHGPATPSGAGTGLPGDVRGADPDLPRSDRGLERSLPVPERWDLSTAASAAALHNRSAVGTAAAPGAAGGIATSGTGAQDGGCDAETHGGRQGRRSKGTEHAGPDEVPDVGPPAAAEPEGVGGGSGEGMSADERRRRCAEAALARFGQGRSRPLGPPPSEGLVAAASRMQQPGEQLEAELPDRADGEYWPAAAGPSGKGALPGAAAVAGAATAPAVGTLERPGPGSAPTCPGGSGGGQHGRGGSGRGEMRRDNISVARVIHAIVDSDSDVEGGEEQPQDLEPRAYGQEASGPTVEGERKLPDARLLGEGNPTRSEPFPRGKGAHQDLLASRRAPSTQGVVTQRVPTIVEVVDLVDDDSDVE